MRTASWIAGSTKVLQLSISWGSAVHSGTVSSSSSWKTSSRHAEEDEAPPDLPDHKLPSLHRSVGRTWHGTRIGRSSPAFPIGASSRFMHSETASCRLPPPRKATSSRVLTPWEVPRRSTSKAILLSGQRSAWHGNPLTYKAALPLASAKVLPFGSTQRRTVGDARGRCEGRLLTVLRSPFPPTAAPWPPLPGVAASASGRGTVWSPRPSAATSSCFRSPASREVWPPLLLQLQPPLLRRASLRRRRRRLLLLTLAMLLMLFIRLLLLTAPLPTPSLRLLLLRRLLPLRRRRLLPGLLLL
mmetsp:Transcript_46799/g.100215  ORF Transcript_46799/g.100215 Transcript_46799/m.100215 type:complete len:300 (-) Transcript_46799:853-1752(-)